MVSSIERNRGDGGRGVVSDGQGKRMMGGDGAEGTRGSMPSTSAVPAIGAPHFCSAGSCAWPQGGAIKSRLDRIAQFEGSKGGDEGTW